MSIDPSPIRILTVDDHPLIHVWIATLVAPESMNSIDVMIAIRDEFPAARIIVLTTYTGDVQVLRSR